MEVMRKAIQLYTSLLKMADVCPSHGIGHALKVLENCRRAIDAHLSQMQGEKVNEELVLSTQLAALLHDADDHKLFPKNLNNENVIMVLQQAGASPRQIEEVIDMINLVSFRKNGDNVDPSLDPLYYFPRHADRIEAIGGNGVLRCYQYNRTIKAPLYVQTTPKVLCREDIPPIIQGRAEKYMKNGGSSDSFIDHFYDKLLHVECPATVRENAFFRDEYDRNLKEVEDFVIAASLTNFEQLDEQIKRLTEQYA